MKVGNIFCRLVFTALVLSQAGCGGSFVPKATPATVDRNNVVSPDVKDFPKSEVGSFKLSIINATFLWKSGVTPNDVTRMGDVGDGLGALATAGDVLARLEPALQQIKGGLSQLPATLPLTADAPPTKQLRGGLQQVCGGLVRLVEGEIQQEQLQAASDGKSGGGPITGGDTSGQIIQALQAQSAQLKGVIAVIAANQLSTENALKFANSTIQDIDKQNLEIGTKENAIRYALAPKFSEAFTLPAVFEVRSQADGSFYIGLDGWKYAGDSSTDAPVNYSTENRNIQNVTYEDHGGVFAFDVYVPNGQIYNIKISRNHYELINDGFISFYGDIIVKDGAGNELRYGVAKFYGRK